MELNESLSKKDIISALEQLGVSFTSTRISWDSYWTAVASLPKDTQIAIAAKIGEFGSSACGESDFEERSKRRPTSPLEPISEQVCGSRVQMDFIEKAIYRGMNASLSERDSEIFALWDSGESTKEIAEIYQLSPRQVQRILVRARDSILDYVNEKENWYQVFFVESNRSKPHQLTKRATLPAEIKEARELIEELGFDTAYKVDDLGKVSSKLIISKGSKSFTLTQRQVILLAKTIEYAGAMSTDAWSVSVYFAPQKNGSNHILASATSPKSEECKLNVSIKDGEAICKAVKGKAIIPINAVLIFMAERKVEA